MSELAGGKVSGTEVDEYPNEIPRRRIELRPRRSSHVLGIEVAAQRQASVLRKIELEVDERDGIFEVEVPGFRPDLVREADLIEEVARLVGFDILPATLPPGRVGQLEPAQRLERNVRRTLVDLGLYEAWTPSLGSRSQLETLALDEAHPAWNMVRLSNAMSEDQDAMRTSLLPGLLTSAARNMAHRAPGVALFELARVYEPSGKELPDEPLVLGAVFAGERRPKEWFGDAERWDYSSAKGVLEALCRSAGVEAPRTTIARGMPFHPTRAARIELRGKPAGVVGEIHPDVCERYRVPEGTVALEMSFGPLVEAIPERPQVADLPRFPGVLLDVAVVVDEGIEAVRVMDLVVAAGAPELATARLFDIYRGDQVGSGKKSLAVALEFKDPERTMTEEEALRVRDRIVTALGERLGAELRG
jgi:phenylalanyl-tRNA synthetase beta chain